MVCNRDLIGEYVRSLSEEPEEVRFLKSVPWVIDAGHQTKPWLIKGPRLEAARLAELPRRMLFSLITPLWNTPPRFLDELVSLQWDLVIALTRQISSNCETRPGSEMGFGFGSQILSPLRIMEEATECG